jgi:hypothetical protein
MRKEALGPEQGTRPNFYKENLKNLGRTFSGTLLVNRTRISRGGLRERRGESVEQVLSRKKVYCGNKAGMGQVIGTQKKPGFSTLIMLGMISMMWGPGSAFLAYYCTNQSNSVETYSLLESDECVLQLMGMERWRLLCLERLCRSIAR